MLFENPYWSNQTKLALLAKWLIVHSAVYYKLHDSVVSDKAFDNNAKQYVKLAKQEAEINNRWQYVMYDFDGTTGFHLFSRLSVKDQHDIMHIAYNVLAQTKIKSLGGTKK